MGSCLNGEGCKWCSKFNIASKETSVLHGAQDSGKVIFPFHTPRCEHLSYPKYQPWALQHLTNALAAVLHIMQDSLNGIWWSTSFTVIVIPLWIKISNSWISCCVYSDISWGLCLPTNKPIINGLVTKGMISLPKTGQNSVWELLNNGSPSIFSCNEISSMPSTGSRNDEMKYLTLSEIPKWW